MLGDQYEIFDAETAEANTIEARFDGHDVSDPKFQGRCRRLKRVFVDLEANAVTRRVQIPVEITGLLNPVTAVRVDITSKRAVRDCVESGELDIKQKRIDLLLPWGRFTDHITAGHIGVVAVDEGSDVDHDRVTFDDPTEPGLMVRTRCVIGSTRNDGVVTRSVGAAPTHPVLEFIANVRLGRLLCKHLYDLCECLVGDLAGSGDSSDLTRILRPASIFDQPIGGDQREDFGEFRPSTV